MGMGGDVGGAVGDIIGALIGEALAKGDYDKAEALQKEAARAYNWVSVPERSVTMDDPTAFTEEMTRGDPELRGAQLAALRKLQQVGLEGGMDAESKAALLEGQQQAANYEQGQRGALMADAYRRGMGGSNLSMASQLGAQQAGAARVGMQGVQAAADARRRALQSLQGSADIGRGMSQDDFQRNAARAQAIDAIHRFNTGLRSDFQQNQFGNTMALQGARYGAKRDEADIYQRKGEKTSNTARGIGRGVGTIAGTGVEAAAGGGMGAGAGGLGGMLVPESQYY